MGGIPAKRASESQAKSDRHHLFRDCHDICACKTYVHDVKWLVNPKHRRCSSALIIHSHRPGSNHRQRLGVRHRGRTTGRNKYTENKVVWTWRSRRNKRTPNCRLGALWPPCYDCHQWIVRLCKLPAPSCTSTSHPTTHLGVSCLEAGHLGASCLGEALAGAVEDPSSCHPWAAS